MMLSSWKRNFTHIDAIMVMDQEKTKQGKTRQAMQLHMLGLLVSNFGRANVAKRSIVEGITLSMFKKIGKSCSDTK